MTEVTHFIVELDFPKDSRYLRHGQNDEYYGIGKPLIMCKDCKHMDWSMGGVCTKHPVLKKVTVDPMGYCYLAERYRPYEDEE